MMSEPSTYPLLLASTSEYKKKLLGRLGYPFKTCKPHYDESVVNESDFDPTDLALHHSKQKALHTPASQSELVLGADQVCFDEEGILHKPHCFEKAVKQLSRLSGKTHTLCTAFSVVIDQKVVESQYHLARMTMRRLTANEIEAYLKQDEPYSCCGSYMYEKHGIGLFEKVETQDSSTIEGLPLFAVHQSLLRWLKKFK